MSEIYLEGAERRRMMAEIGYKKSHFILGILCANCAGDDVG